MKKLLWVCLFIIFSFFPVQAEEPVNLNKVEKPAVKLKPPVKKLNGSLVIKDKKIIEDLIELQKQKDLEDIENLWKGTVENDKVIEFALKKLSTPESQRRIHSSLMSKTLSAIISGASFIPAFVGGDAYIQTSSFAIGKLAQIENLQDRLIDSYYNYKNSLSLLKDTRSRLLLYNKNYTQALDNGNILEITISSSMYDNMVLQEYQAEQAAKKYHLELQRLAGKKAVDNLNLYQFNINSTLYKGGIK